MAIVIRSDFCDEKLMLQDGFFGVAPNLENENDPHSKLIRDCKKKGTSYTDASYLCTSEIDWCKNFRDKIFRSLRSNLSWIFRHEDR